MVAINELRRRTFVTRVYTGADPIPETDHPDAPKITLDGGYLDVNSIIVPDPEYHLDSSTITWKYDVPGMFWAGKLHLSHDGNIVTGHIVAGKHHSEAKITTFVGYIKPTTYLTKVTDPTGSVQDGPSVTIGYKMDPHTQFPTQVFQIGGIDYDDVEIHPGESSSTIFKLRASDKTIEYAEADPESFPVSMEFTMRFDALHFEGTFEKLVSVTEEGKPITEQLQWTGDADLTEQTAFSAPALHLTKLESGKPRESSTCFEPYVHPSVTHLSATATKNPLSVLELFSMSQSPEGVQELANKLLIRNMKYCLKDEWRENLLGEQKPLITKGDPGTKALDIPGAREFYGHDFAMGYFGNAFYQRPPAGSSTKISEDDGYKLKYYLAKGLPKGKHYNEQTHSLYLDAFLLKEPRLEDYIADQKTRDDKDYWAKKLYDVLVSDEQINILVLRFIHDGKLNPIEIYKTYATVLNLLQPSGEFAGKVMEKIISALLQHLGVKSKHGDREMMMKWLPDMIEAYIKEFLIDPKIPVDAQEKLALEESARQLKKLADFFGGFKDLASALVDAILGTKVWDGASLPSKVSQWMKTFKQNHPKIAGMVGKLPHILLGLMYAGGLFALAMAIKGWDHLTPVQKAQSITNAVFMAGHLFADTFRFVEWSGAQLIKLIKRVESLASPILERMGVLLRAVCGGQGWFTEMATALGRFYKGAKGIVIKTGEILKSLVKHLEKVLRFLGPLMALAAAGFTAYQLYVAITTRAGGAEIAMDSLMLISSLLETAFLAAKLVLSVSWAGPLAFVCAVVGVIAMLVKMFLPQKPKPSPVEVFISNDLSQFTETLEDPPKDWIGKQKKKEEQ
ncbi:hypothetical protein GJAV_G00168820 [Gymnothorax javanicus]|nr:hypothetical protein GJAV_G00168820 [Gymnothorax javanicus]